MYLNIIALILVGALAYTIADMPIPRHELGYFYKDGHHCAPVKIAAFIDLNCPKSKAAFQNLLPAVDSFNGSDVKLRVYVFSLSRHRNSHLLAKAARFLHGCVQNSTSKATVFDWMKLAFDNLDNLSNRATCNLTENQIVDYISTLAQSQFPVTDDEFIEGVYSTDIDGAVDLEWKYCCTRGVYGTPMFTVNDVFVNAPPTWPASRWVELIKGLLPSHSTFHGHDGC